MRPDESRWPKLKTLYSRSIARVYQSRSTLPPATAFVGITTIDGSRDPVIVTATNPSGDEAGALNQLAHRLGLDTDPN